MQKVANFRHLRPAGTASMWGGSGSGQREAPRRHFKKAATPYEGPTVYRYRIKLQQKACPSSTLLQYLDRRELPGTGSPGLSPRHIL